MDALVLGKLQRIWLMTVKQGGLGVDSVYIVAQIDAILHKLARLISISFALETTNENVQIVRTRLLFFFRISID